MREDYRSNNADLLGSPIRRSPIPPHERVPWRSIEAGAVGIGIPLGAMALYRLLGSIVLAVELGMSCTVIGTALFGTKRLSDRAFRILRWLGNRPEPPAPTPSLDEIESPLPRRLACTGSSTRSWRIKRGRSPI